MAGIESLGSGERYVIPTQCTVTEAVTVPAGGSVEGGTFELERGESITLVPSPDDGRRTSLASTIVRGGNDAARAVVAGSSISSPTVERQEVDERNARRGRPASFATLCAASPDADVVSALAREARAGSRPGARCSPRGSAYCAASALRAMLVKCTDSLFS